LQKLAVVWAKNANIFAKFFGKNIFKIITSVPDWRKFYCLGCHWEKIQFTTIRTRYVGANPTITSYNAGVVKIYNATNRMARFQNACKGLFSILKML
jgi:hypothetical protein